MLMNDYEPYNARNVWYLPKGKKNVKDVRVKDFRQNHTDISALSPKLQHRIELEIAQGCYRGHFHPDLYDEDYLIRELKKMGLHFDKTHTGDIQHQYLMDGDDYLLLSPCGHSYAIQGELASSKNGWYCPGCGLPFNYATHMETEEFEYLDGYLGKISAELFEPVEKENKYRYMGVIGTGDDELNAKLGTLKDEYLDYWCRFYYNHKPYDSKVPKSTVKEASAFITNHPILVNAFNKYRDALLNDDLEIAAFYTAVMNSKDKNYFLAMDKAKKPTPKKKPAAKKTPVKKPATKPKVAAKKTPIKKKPTSKVTKK